ncbi:hypothetical protein HNR44_000628 [Geomicrobium halophilum]|uniref:LarA-like N-terminal domain-containing protein n=1 Tax=Geomicrobium halophilum TaxID=549000 RepID=A0A841PIX0_9BACL|nr:lactate racemase domain-containing protein [Geomicrobium halophilum]MBB6448679.1 hypothetical protein [Geomicrobium halophilum]
MSVINTILEDIPVPKMIKVKQNFYAPEVQNIVSEMHVSIQQANVLSRISKGDRVAIGIGSRGLADLHILTREMVNAVKSVGGEPFIFPAMGSHGGATAKGQREVLENLGITEDFIGAPISCSMEVVEIGRLPNGLAVYLDKEAHQADKIMFIARIKPHTAFRGPYESGLAKMITIGFGKQKGAESAHAHSFKYMAKHVPDMAKMVIDKAPIIFGLGTIENAYDRIAKVVAIPAEKILEDEPDLLEEAKSLMPRILFDPIDVLVIDEIGKDISGSGMDPNITGRFATPYASGGPEVNSIAVLDLTKETQGNANGIGNADITTRKLFEKIEWEKGFANALTSTVSKTVKLPMFLDSDKLAVQAAIKTAALEDSTKIRLIWIKNTLQLKEIWISEALLENAKENNDIEILGESEYMAW